MDDQAQGVERKEPGGQVRYGCRRMNGWVKLERADWLLEFCQSRRLTRGRALDLAIQALQREQAATTGRG